MGSLILALAIVICARWFFRSGLPDALAESVRQKHGGAVDPGILERLEELTERIDDEMGELRAEVVELTERVEFTERVLIEVRNREGLPAEGASSGK